MATGTAAPRATGTASATAAPSATSSAAGGNACISGAGGGTVTVQMQAQNNSGQSGTATLTDVGGTQTRVEVNLTGGTGTATQPTHIHSGTCANLGDIVYGLNNLTVGKSTTTLNVALSSLTTGKFVINAHKSDAEITTYTSCGPIPSKTG